MRRDEVEKVGVDGSQVMAVFVTILEASPGDLRELASSIEAGGRIRVGVGCVDGPVSRG